MSTTRVLLAAVLTLAGAGLGCAGDGPEWAAWPTDDWPVSTPEEQGMDSGVLADFVDAVVAADGIEAAVVVRNGYVVVDTVVHPYPDGAPHALRSVTKSVVGTLIGVAVDRGLLAGVDVPVVEILVDDVPESVDERKAAMTVEDLLMMTSGLECRDSYLYDWEGMATMTASSDWAAHVLALPMADEPGTTFEYCNGASMLLSAILSEVTGRPASEFAREVLFEPLGISEFTWAESPGGASLGWMGLWLRPGDLAKVGLLHLRDGEWDDVRVVSREWVETATSAQIDAGTLSDGYGYQWWVDDAGYSLAQGYGGQHLVVAPEQHLVAAFVSSLPAERSGEPEALVEDHVLPAVVSDDPLPPNQDENGRLSAAIAGARSGPEPTVPTMPATARIVDGARYEAEANEMGISSLGIRFADDSAIVDVEVAGERMPFGVGLGGRFEITEVPGQPPTAARGEWVSDDSFVVEVRSIGEVERGSWELSFDGTRLRSVLTFAGEIVVSFSGELAD